MSLATACPACGTVFRVVEDQLNLSEGWVRCGQCSEVFNALESLFDLERLGRQLALPEPTEVAVATPREAPGPDDRATDTDTRWDRFADLGELEPVAPRPFPVEPTEPGLERQASPWELAAATVAARPTSVPSVPVSAVVPLPADEGLATVSPDEVMPHSSGAVPGSVEDRHHGLDPSWTVTNGADEVEGRGPARTDVLPGPESLQEPSAAETDTPAPLPRFVVQAQRAERWRHPGRRFLLAGLGGLGALALMLQLSWSYRDLGAVRWPISRLWLEPWAAARGVTLEPPRRLDDLVVDSSTLTRTPGADAYRLQLTLVNRANHAVRAPHLELSLSDSGGGLVVRRSLAPADFRQNGALEPGEHTWQLDFSSDDRQLPGYSYTVQAFYP